MGRKGGLGRRGDGGFGWFVLGGGREGGEVELFLVFVVVSLSDCVITNRLSFSRNTCETSKVLFMSSFGLLSSRTKHG